MSRVTNLSKYSSIFLWIYYKFKFYFLCQIYSIFLCLIERKGIFQVCLGYGQIESWAWTWYHHWYCSLEIWNLKIPCHHHWCPRTQRFHQEHDHRLVIIISCLLFLCIKQNVFLKAVSVFDSYIGFDCQNQYLFKPIDFF